MNWFILGLSCCISASLYVDMNSETTLVIPMIITWIGFVATLFGVHEIFEGSKK